MPFLPKVGGYKGTEILALFSEGFRVQDFVRYRQSQKSFCLHGQRPVQAESRILSVALPLSASGKHFGPSKVKTTNQNFGTSTC